MVSISVLQHVHNRSPVPLLIYKRNPTFLHFKRSLLLGSPMKSGTSCRPSTVAHTKNDRSFPQEKKGGRSLPFPNLVSLVAVILLPLAGMVSIQDACFVPFSVIYVFYISKFVFPPAPRPYDSTIFGKSKLFAYYYLASVVLGVVLPVVYILDGMYMYGGDKAGVRAAAQHFFLLSGQGVMEAWFTIHGGFSKPVHVVMLIFYHVRRIFSLVQWLNTEIARSQGSSALRMFMGRALAALNLGFWWYNLFGFILPLYLPRAFQKYYSTTKENAV